MDSEIKCSTNENLLPKPSMFIMAHSLTNFGCQKDHLSFGIGKCLRISELLTNEATTEPAARRSPGGPK